MAYNMPYGQAMHSQPFFGGNMANSHFLHQDDMMEIDNSWMENIDPLLRQAQLPDTNTSWQLESFITRPERALFTANLLPTQPQFPRGLTRPAEGIAPLPRPTQGRMSSPSFSQELSSQCSSARSPGAEPDWSYEGSYSPQTQEDYSLPNATSHLSQGLPDLWTDRSQRQIFPQIQNYGSCVSLNQVQSFADPQEIVFENADEGYVDIEHIDLKHDYAIEVDHRSNNTHNSYRHSSDEGLGPSIKDSGSPTHSTIHASTDFEADADADADLEDEPVANDSEPSDTEYTPKSTRTRKRRLSSTHTPTKSPPQKRSRIAKASKNSKGAYICKQCPHQPFQNASALQKHINVAHTRAFVCVFAWAGCVSTFASKNEWKRHVSSQHLNLNSWVCTLGACGKSSTGKKDGAGATGGGKGAEFNRKDLFTQHLRRMHSPLSVKRQNKKNVEWEERLKELQQSCLRVKRLPPRELRCPVNGCGTVFEGNGCWDDRMEHVGKHLEKCASGGEEVRQEDDGLLVEWARREGIVERRVGGGWRLGGGWVEREGEGEGDDVDADGEDE